VLGHLVSNLPVEHGRPLKLIAWLKRLLARLGLR